MAVQGSATITIPKTLSSINVVPSSVTLHPTNTYTFRADGIYNDATTSPATVTWSATGGQITSGGVYTAGSVLGNYTVTATSTINPSLQDTAAVGITASTGTGGADWVGDFETGNLSQYRTGNACPGCATVYSTATQPSWPAPPGGHTYACRLRTRAGDIQSCCNHCGSPTDNPRCQIESPYYYQIHSEMWCKFWVYFPTDFPAWTSNSTFMFFESIYNLGGTGENGFRLGSPTVGSNNYHLWVNGGSGWHQPLVKGTWVKLMKHLKLEKDNTGFIEIWMNDVMQAMPNAGGATRWVGKTMNTTAEGGTDQANGRMTNYWKVNTWPEATIYVAGYCTGRTRASIGE